MSALEPRTEAQDSPRTHDTVPTETPVSAAVEGSQRPTGCLVRDDEARCWVYHHLEGDEPTPQELADMVTEAERKLESPSTPINTLLTGLEEGTSSTQR